MPTECLYEWTCNGTPQAVMTALLHWIAANPAALSSGGEVCDSLTEFVDGVWYNVNVCISPQPPD